jgi:hypothetical protein
MFLVAFLGLAAALYSIPSPSVDEMTASSGLGTRSALLSDAAYQRIGEGAPAIGRSRTRAVKSGYDALLTHAFTLAADPDLLVLRDGAYDPMEGLPVRKDLPLSQALSAKARLLLEPLSLTRIQLVQFTDAVDVYTVRDLRAKGFDVVGFIPNNAYLVRVPVERQHELDGLVGVRWSGELPWTQKLDASISSALLNGVAQPRVFVQVAGYAGEMPDNWQDLALELGAERILYSAPHDSVPRMMLDVPAPALRDIAAGLAQVPGVSNIRIFEIPRLLNSGSTWLLQSGDPNLKSTPLFDAGLTGWGQVYAAADSGLDTDACQFRYSADSSAQTKYKKVPPPRIEVSNPDDKVLAYYVLTGADAYDESSGGYHGTQTTGCAVGDNYAVLAGPTDPGVDHADGMAPGAQIVFQDIGTKLGYLFGLAMSTQYQISRQAYDSGARVHNDSYGQEGSAVAYDQDSQMLDDFCWEVNDYTVFFAAGNSGPSERTLGGEGSTAKNTLVVGASMPGWYENGEDMIYFSSRGPTSDQRIKPDIMAPGLIESAAEVSGVRLEGKTNVYGQPAVVSKTDPPNNQCAVSMTSGTSFASPTAAGMGLLVRQYFTDGFYPSGAANPDDGWSPTSALVRAVMINSSRNMTGDVLAFTGGGDVVSRGSIDPAPSTMQGWGRLTLDDALYLRGDRRDLMVFADIYNGEDGAIMTGDTAEYEVYVKAGQNLKVSLAWIDPNGEVGTGRTLVNDLDLEVVSPEGDFYRGNVAMEEGVSNPVEKSEPSDVLNPQEQVIVDAPVAGTWTVRVVGSSVPGNGRFYPHESSEQGYALIATGDLGEGPDQLFPRIASAFDRVSGGCDSDDSLDKNEVVDISVDIFNSGDGDSGPLKAVVRLEEEGSTIPLDAVIIPNAGVFAVVPVKAKTRSSLTVKLGLGAIDENICEQSLAVAVDITTEDDEWLDTVRFVIPLGVDTIDDGTVVCQRMECAPPADVTSVEPSRVYAGQDGFSMSIKGHYFKSGINLRFEPEVIAYDSLEVSDPTTLVLKKVVVADEAEVGPVIVYVQNPDELELGYEGLLEVFIPDVIEDGDETPADGDTGDNPETPGVTTGGCASTTAPGWLLAALVALLVWRRRSVA